MRNCRSWTVVARMSRTRNAIRVLLSVAVALATAMASRSAGAQLAPTGGHYAARASDTGHDAGQVGPGGHLSAAVALEPAIADRVDQHRHLLVSDGQYLA